MLLQVVIIMVVVCCIITSFVSDDNMVDPQKKIMISTVVITITNVLEMLVGSLLAILTNQVLIFDFLHYCENSCNVSHKLIVVSWRKSVHAMRPMVTR